MRKHNAENERIKRAYFIYLKEARRLSEHSIDAAAAAIGRFEEYTRYREFKRFHTQQAVGFKRRLAAEINRRIGEPLSKSTIYTTLNALRAFFQWLAGQQGYRSSLTYSDSDYFNLSEKEARVAKASPEKRTPSIDQILHVLHVMPASSAIEKRNRAVIAFILLTGVRDGAAASLKLKHVDLADGNVVQDAREVKTKFSKTFTTCFFPVGGEALQIVVDWISFLQRDMLFGPDDPLFPATEVVLGKDQQFEAAGLSRLHWSTATPIRRILKDAFTKAGLPYFNPHSFRRTLAQLGERLCHTPEEFKAWSQNLGHEMVLTTFSSYGEVARDRQAKLIRQLGQISSPQPYPKEALEQILHYVQTQHGRPGAATTD
jgi:integrase/recombinase XerD